MSNHSFCKEILLLDCAIEVQRICERVKKILGTILKRRGLVIGVSGGIDSSVTLALAVKALGKENVIVLQMPECHSANETLYLSGLVADHFGVQRCHEDITGILEAAGFYSRYVEIVQTVIPTYDETWKSKIVLSNTLDDLGYSFFSIVAQPPEGNQVKTRLDLKAYLGIVAATNFKQRIRKMLEYYHADRLNYAVAGTPNRLEYDQGFFVKLGDGAADIKLIAHLYKSQVYQLAAYLGVPKEICKRLPTTDTYSLTQGQDEFYFQLPYEKMDLCLYAKNNGITATVVAPMVDLTEGQVQRVFTDIDSKRKSTRYLHLKPQLIEDVSEIKC